MSKIEWTEKTWNPFVGCSVTSAGCKNCYAMRMAARIQKMQPGGHYDGTTKIVNDQVVWTGEIAAAPDAKWTEPLRRQKPTVYFVNSMGDMFHPNVSDEFIERAFVVMLMARQHTFQVLTKYPDRMRSFLNLWHSENFVEPYGGALFDMFHRHAKQLQASNPSLSDKIDDLLEWQLAYDNEKGVCTRGNIFPNVWLGVSIESADHLGRLDILRETVAAIRFVSFEPLLGPINDVNFTDIDWAIIGGESGKGSRPMHPDWALSLRDQCLETRTLFFFKQWGDWIAYIDRDRDDPDWRQNYADGKTFQILNLAGGRGFHGERVHQMQRVGKFHTGRLLDGQIWNERPPLISESEDA